MDASFNNNIQIVPNCTIAEISDTKMTSDIATVLDVATAEQLVKDIHTQADLLFDTWTKTNNRVRDWQQQINTTKQVGYYVTLPLRVVVLRVACTS
jgi:hypothetical protein